MEGGFRLRKITALIIALMIAVPSFAGDLMDESALNMRKMNDMNMGNILPNYKGTGSFTFDEDDDAGSYNLSRMKQMNPDFTTYSDAQGIIWLKRVTVSRSESGGIEIARLYVILGRQGLGGNWLNWNIPIPAKGSVDVLEASVYDFSSLAQVSTIQPEDDASAGVKAVRFAGLPDTFIIALSWRENLTEQLSVEGLCWFQEDLRVWESIVEIISPQKLSYVTFPGMRRPDTEESDNDTVYTWRRINLDPYADSGELARIQREGVAFSTRQGNSALAGIVKEAESSGGINAPSEALAGFKRSKNDGALRLVEWLSSQPEITLAEGSPRKIPNSGAWTKREKLILAKSWLASQKVDASLCWRIPFDPDERTPLCPGIFSDPVLYVQGVKGIEFHDMADSGLIAGAKIYSINNEGRLISRRIPSSKSADNRLSAVMDLKLSEQGMLSGNMRVILRGRWPALMLGANPNDGTARGAVLSLFPGLTNYKDVKYRNLKDAHEISFTLTGKPGVAGTGRGILAIIPVFEPVMVRKLATYDAPVEVKFPFVIDQNITIGFPKNASEALISGKTPKNPDKINYSDSYQNRRHRLISDSRLEVNMQSISAGNMSLLRRCLDNWRIFSTKHIPVR